MQGGSLRDRVRASRERTKGNGPARDPRPFPSYATSSYNAPGSAPGTFSSVKNYTPAYAGKNYAAPTSTYASGRMAEDLEEGNNQHVDALNRKVRLLKDVTINIGNEVRDSNKLLSGMNDAFSETTLSLKGAYRKMVRMASRQGVQWRYWVGFLLICFLIFFLTWAWRR